VLSKALKKLKKDYHKYSEERWRASEAVETLAGAAIPVLLQALVDNNEAVRSCVCWLLGQTGSHGKSAVSSLICALEDEAPAVRKAAAEALGEIGPQARTAVPALTQLIEENFPVAVKALWKIGPEGIAAVPGSSEFQSLLEAAFMEDLRATPKSG